MSKGAVLLVEDDNNIANLVTLYLENEGFRVLRESNGEIALARVDPNLLRLVILDVGLRGAMDGLEVCRRLRAKSSVPILFLTARDAEIDRVVGLELGADDYVTKPFSPRELVARVTAILRRSDPTLSASSSVLMAGDVEVDTARCEARVGGTAVDLAAREFSLLQFFAENPGLALTRSQLLSGVWGENWYGDDRTVDVHVRQLRKKLGDAFPLNTVWGVGYRLG